MLEVKLVDIGEGITEGEIIQYLVKEGEQVAIDQPLVEIQTDKVVAELPAPSSGIVKQILIPPGQSVQVGTTLIYLETAEARVKLEAMAEVETKIGSAPPKHIHAVSIQQEENITVQEKKTPTFKRVLATPYTRKIAREHGLNLEDVPAADPSGRVKEEDVYRFIRERDNKKQTASATQDKLVKEVFNQPTTINHAAKQIKDGVSKSSEQTNLPQEILPFRGIRKQIAQHMSRSLYTIPHVSTFEEVDLTNLLTLRQALKEANSAISVTAFLVKALVQALKDFPIFNAELDEENENIILKKEYNIGLATDTKDGLLVPVLRQAHRKSLREIHSEIKEITEQAKSGSLSPALLQNSTFTISNVGPLGGGLFATPIINYPETALIAFHQTKKRPVVNEHDQIVIRQIMTLSFSFDHRVADGATAIAFIKRFSNLVEQPNTLLLELI